MELSPKTFFFMLLAMVLLLGLTIVNEGSRTYVNNLYQYNVYNVASADENSIPNSQDILIAENKQTDFITTHAKISDKDKAGVCMAPQDPDQDLNNVFAINAAIGSNVLMNGKKMMAGKRQFLKFQAHQERSGTGDRLAGSMTGFHESSRNGKQLHLRWTNIDKVFKPSCMLDNQFDPERRPLVVLNGTRKRLGSGSCKGQTWYQCKIIRHNQDKCPIY
eukprot:CAMPEP_0204832238 /NCGR_PEP_ID=MMETSP1346-20131115/12891_1 /ASSEMBLY_ACC=CAM_ASM_000771 /TAXON_ID=215587 /ORGANISM="Aplanochytrium stocchinoi, Strain GSBS06" /LENGTH=218 /DNA_ID=CAMNT_0051963885 /DNA_START=45 /DNA_END=699 /DNA_ORIENTATION=+